MINNKSLLEKEISDLKKRLTQKEEELARIEENEHNVALNEAEQKFLGKSFRVTETQGFVTYIGNVTKVVDVTEAGVKLDVQKLVTISYNAMGSYDIHIENITSLKRIVIKNTMNVFELKDNEFDDVVSARVVSAINSYLN
jgi:ATP-dependent 26S proteasome regulatory subunit